MLMRPHQHGDTIVEVLIAMAITSLILGGAYTTSSRALQVGRRAQERSEALKLVEGQIEELKLMAPNPTKNVFDPLQNKFCVFNSQKYPMANLAAYPYRSECFRNSLYNVGVDYDQAADDTFTVSATWDRLGSDDLDKVIIKYRLHP